MLAMLVLTTFLNSAIGQEADMSRYITFDVVAQTGIELRADTDNTPIKIVKENGSSEDSVVGLDWTNIYFNEPNESITIYGDIRGFKTYMFPHSGIENIHANNCTGLEELCCISSQLTTLDVSNLTNLKRLDCSYNWLTSLNVNNLKGLEILNCYSNRLTNIDLSDLTALKRLSCNDNVLTSLDVSNSTLLEELHCYNNHIQSINLNNITKLTILDCGDNQLTTIDVSNLTNLRKLFCFINQLTTLDVGNLINLEELICYGNQLNDIHKLNNLTNLTMLNCRNNRLSSINISNLTDLKYLYCSENQLTTLDVNNLTKLIELYCYDNQLSTLDISNLPVLKSLSCHQNNFTTQASDDIYCALPIVEGKIFPAYCTEDYNINNVLASNAQNARDKNWLVSYHMDNSDITTTGNYECTTNINAIELDSSVKVYPNPVSDLLYIESENIINGVRVYDISGKEIQNKSVDFSNNTSINVSNLIDGTYFLQIYTDKGIGKHSFIKK